MKAVSHIAIGVRDMDRSLGFYRDLLGLKVCLDTMENIGGLKTLFVNPVKGKRRMDEFQRQKRWGQLFASYPR